jgi:SsrA-binding protein
MTDYKNITIKNKRASFDYEILESFVAGVVLVGTEIKSLRLGKASMVDCYCYFDQRGELWIRGLNITEYHWGTHANHVPRRDRKLLLNGKELRKLQRAVQDKSITIAGLKLFINERGLAKVAIGLARGRKSYDKREYIKEKDARREIDRNFRK